MNTQEHATGHICVDCLMLLANGDWPCDMSESELAEYRQAIESHPNYSLEMTLGHLCDSPDSNCWHAGKPCEDDCDCERDDFSTMPCDMCGSYLAGSREDVTIWWDA
jgi:hypothetical protein